MALNRDASWSSPAFRPRRHTGPITVCWYSQLHRRLIPWITMSPLSHRACPVCPQTVAPHMSPAATPLVSSTRAAGLLGEWLAGGFCLGFAVEQLLHFRQSSILNQGAAEQSVPPRLLPCLLTGCFPGQLGKAMGRSAALHLYSDYHPHGITTGWSNSMSTLNGTISSPLSLPLWRGKQGKVSRK